MYPGPFGPLLDVVEKELGIADDLRDKVWSNILAVFQQWKQEHGKRRPSIDGHAFSNFESAEPWQCADATVENNIDLGIRLWIDSYDPFSKLCKKHGLETILGVLLINEAHRFIISAVHHYPSVTHLASIFLGLRLDAYKAQLQYLKHDLERTIAMVAPPLKKVAESKSNLAKGRIAGSLENKKRAEEKHRLWRKAAIDAFKHNPHRNYDWVVEKVIQEKAYGTMKNGKPYSHRRILDVIAGTKEEALRALSKGVDS